MTNHLFKSFEMKANELGGVSGFFSTYEKTPDSYGDIIEPGAFTRTIENRKATGHPFPLCFNHDFSAVIGAVDSIEDTETGPYLEATLLDTERAQDVRKMLKSGAIYQFSFAYDVIRRRDPTAEEKAAGVRNVLQEVDVFEISVVTLPANQEAVVTEVKAGRRNRKTEEETIKQIISLAQSLIDDGEDIENGKGENEETKPKANGAPEEPTVKGNSKKAAALLTQIQRIKETKQ